MDKENKKITVGITGQHGFIGTHVYNMLGLYPNHFTRIEFQRFWFDNEYLLDRFVSNCDVIVHLAGVNRGPDPEDLYKSNITLAEKLIASLKRCHSKAHIIFSSSTQEAKDNQYGRSKKLARLLFVEWAQLAGARFSGLVIPNVFGPFGEPFYNSVVATFCYQLTNGETSTIHADNELSLIYVDELATEIISIIRDGKSAPEYEVKSTASASVSEILELLKTFRDTYFEKGIIPQLKNKFALQLFNTYRSYINPDKRYPISFKLHTDNRGDFAEIIRLGEGISGQVSFSTTVPGATRGNHFHTRKIERFAVISGEALIRLRRVGTPKIFEFRLSGKAPSYVDMPVWTLHNISNIGSEPLYTIFWINEPYDEADPDTFFEEI